MDKQDLILAIVILIAAVTLTDAVWGADIIYEDGTMVTVPDEWVKIEQPRQCEEKQRLIIGGFNTPPSGILNCAEEPDHPKCLRQQDVLRNE